VWAPGPPPPFPWHAAPSTAEVAAAVSPLPRPLEPAFAGARHSAVLIALADGPHGAEVLLTKRSMTMRNHRGEISFPGGRLDPGETPLDGALREAHEEVGLDPAAVQPTGELDHLNTVVSRSYIVPLVARLAEPLDLVPASPEVDRVLWVPLAELTRPDTYRAERWGTAPVDRVIHFFELDDETIWGATAHLLVDLLAIVTRR
jgi:8-oxo-dGTP pyrophosphatase MutT (NUDIX family)